MKPVYVIALILVILIPVVIVATRPSLPTPSPTATPVVSSLPQEENDPEEVVVLDKLSEGSIVSSPLTITGTVPPGWMFEGQFQVFLMDSERNGIAKTSAQEVEPGSWQSGEPVKFAATLKYATEKEKGILRFEKDNPSGLPENDDSYEINVNFN